MLTPRTITVLPSHVARRIAAGEVVSRPLDVVRELIENALDAGATRLEIELCGGGLDLVRVQQAPRCTSLPSASGARRCGRRRRRASCTS